MVCAMVVFFMVGTHQPAPYPPFITTLDEANRLIENGFFKLMDDDNIYPVIKPCKV